ncbi:histidine--tRNA ligase [Yunchengibacter salinarum]|uniref:histidine--tRNA ligase n=1 Tax=Yunchengibacter salinarum TaxID=3133399 RepID=UPI0035B57F88
MGKLQPARGTRDIVGDEARRMRRVEEAFREAGHLYGFEELTTPIFEFTEVFARPLGESSDIVSKEMYTFEDRGGAGLTLRPEFTAGVCRAFISGGMQQSLPQRLMSSGPAFRYERPQKGRYRQFHQVNAELIGDHDPMADVDMIVMAWRFLKALGLGDAVTLHLNTLGDHDSRRTYREALVAYLARHRDALSPDSQRRLDSNPLRILDSKDEGDRALLADAPRLADSLNDHSRAFFDRVTAGLTAAGVPYELDPHLVRGMDYYTHTAFEFVTDTLGAQGTVLGGGRYDGLVKQLGGPDVPGIGWAAGMERLALMLEDGSDQAVRAVVMPMDDDSQAYGVQVAETLRDLGLVVTSDRSGNMGKRLNRANRAGARYAAIIGSNERDAGQVSLKDLASGTQETLPLVEIAERLGDGGDQRAGGVA